jgi:hypothetical protein
MTYPTINAKELPKLVQIVEQAVANEKYLNPESCPYDEKSIANIRRIIEACESSPLAIATVRPERGKVGRPAKGPTIPMDEVEREVDEIRKELADLKIEGQTMETSDRIQVIKTRAALIERVIGMKERVADVKRIHSFIATVVGMMEEHLNPKERDVLMKELKNYVES